MPEESARISDLNNAGALNLSSLFVVSQKVGSSETYESFNASVSQMASFVNNGLEYDETLITEDKTIVGAINEASRLGLELLNEVPFSALDASSSTGAGYQLPVEASKYKMFLVTAVPESTAHPNFPSAAGLVVYNLMDASICYLYDPSYYYSVKIGIYDISSTDTPDVRVRCSTSWSGGKNGSKTITPAQLMLQVYGLK